jgi:hypothetical protein
MTLSHCPIDELPCTCVNPRERRVCRNHGEFLRVHGWTNVYSGPSPMTLWRTREIADEAAGSRIACVEIDIFVKKGAGL